jgi:prolyl oligopeptidase
MKNLVLIVSTLTILVSCHNNKKDIMEYPQTKKIDSTSIYFGIEINDPYQWLEDDRSAETEDWVRRQNQTTYQYLDQISIRDTFKNRLKELWNYEKRGAPFKRGKNTFVYRNNGLQNHSVLFQIKEEKESVFLDPNNFSKDGTTSLSGLSFTEDGTLVAYSISEGGSDWRKVLIMDVESKQLIEDTLVDIKFSGISWKGNEGFFYSSYDKPKGSELSAKTDQHKVYYHKLGTKQKEDKVIFGELEIEKHRYIGARVTKDQRFLIISASLSTSGNKLFIRDLKQESNPFTTILDHTDSDTYLIENEEDKLYLYTNLDAPNGKVVTVNAKQPTSDKWQEFIAETNEVLSISKGGGYFFAEYMVDAISKVIQYDYKGQFVRNIDLVGVGSVGSIGGKKEEKKLFYSFTNYNTPLSIYQLDVESGFSSLYWTPEIDFKNNDYQSEQVFYRSKDGTKIPMIITYKKGTKLNGKNPTILYGYGGFNISLTPSFSITNAVWLEQGGIYAVANLRGGGEYGKEWHKAGTLMQKQNVFDDFIAGAQFLIDQKYTSSDYLAISGRSNGGLLVGATMTQRPDLVKVALAGVGVLDMLRYHKFTAGAGWAYDYGTSDDNKEMFEYLKNYSPVHNVKEGVSYPATLITTGDHDDRVVPAHSFKFAAQLQEKHKGNNPVLIRIDVNAGHGAGKPVDMIIEEWADIYGFTLYNMFR